jgi:serine/threonine protein kinase
LLGKGSTGNVYLGVHNDDVSHKVAIKSIDLSSIDNEVTRYLLSCEIAALSNLGKIKHSGHENIVRLIDVVIERNHLYMVMEHLQGGTLADYIKQHPQGLPEEEAMLIFRQMVEGYQHIKAKQIVHRDLKPDNILFKRNPRESKEVAIIDFGYCEMAEVPNRPKMFYNVGSPKYMSPEAYTQNKYSEKSDIWAMGVMLYEMLVGSTCDKGLSMEAYLDMVQRQGVPLPQRLRMFQQHLLTNILHYDLSRRFDCDHILKELHANSHHMTRHNSNGQLRNTSSPEQVQSSTKNRQVLFNSVILPAHKVAPENRNQAAERVLRSEIRVKGEQEPNENAFGGRNNQNVPRPSGFSFHVPTKPMPYGP